MGERVRLASLRLIAALALVPGLGPGACASARADDLRAGPGRPPVDVALDRLDAVAAARTDRDLAEEQALALTALEMAGPDALDPVAQRLAAGGARCVVAAWALGEIGGALDAAALPPSVVAALREALRGGDEDCRLAAASALGRAFVGEAASDLAALWRDPYRAPGAEALVLLALMGAGGEEASAGLAEFLARGGDEDWSLLAIAAAVRRGPEAAPALVEAACSHPDGAARATASLALLLLAEPRAACPLAECAGGERDPGIRRLQYQALAASGSPSGVAFLRHAATVETDAELRAACVALAGMRLGVASPGARNRGARGVRQGLARLVRENAPPDVLEDVVAGATGVDLALIERAMRMLPLRPDRRWFDDVSRLSQVRARLLCEAHPECEPEPPRVGRPGP